MSYETSIRKILTTGGKSNAAYWQLARDIAQSQEKVDQTYATVESAWRRMVEEARNNGKGTSALLECPKSSSIRQLGAAHKLWGSVANEQHHPFHAYAWRRLAKHSDTGETIKEHDRLSIAWDHIPTGRPEPKKNAKDETVTIRLPKAQADKLAELAEAAGVDIPTVIAGLLDK